MPESVRPEDADFPCSEDRCAGVRGCADDLPARGVRVCGCVYTAHHTPVPHTTEEPPRCAEPKTRTPNGDPEPVGPLAEQFLDQLAAQDADEELAARRRAAIHRLGRAHTTSPLLTRRQEQKP